MTDGMEFQPPSKTQAVPQNEAPEVAESKPESPQPAIEAGSETPKPEPNQEASSEVSEAKPETPEAIETVRQVEQATFEPEAVVERAGDYKQSEAIEEAFLKSMDAPLLHPEVPQPETNSSDILLEAKSVNDQTSETNPQNSVSGVLSGNFIDETPDSGDQTEATQAVPRTLEQVFTETPIVASRTMNVNQEVLEDKVDIAHPAVKAESLIEKGSLTPASEVGVEAQEGAAEVVNETEQTGWAEEQYEQAQVEAQEAAAEVERAGEALDEFQEEYEDVSENYDATIENLQTGIDQLNDVLAANGFPPVTMTVENGQIILSDNFENAPYWNAPGTSDAPAPSNTADPSYTPHPNPDGSDNGDDISHALAERLTPHLGFILEFDTLEEWTVATALRTNVYALLSMANNAQAYMNEAQAEYDNLQAQYSAAVDKAEAAEARVQATAEVLELAQALEQTPEVASGTFFVNKDNTDASQTSEGDAPPEKASDQLPNSQSDSSPQSYINPNDGENS